MCSGGVSSSCTTSGTRRVTFERHEHHLMDIVVYICILQYLQITQIKHYPQSTKQMGEKTNHISIVREYDVCIVDVRKLSCYDSL